MRPLPQSRPARRVIDCHCHAGKGDGFTGPWDTDASLGRYLERADRAGITETVLLPAFHSDYAIANAGLARIVSARPGRFHGFAGVHAERDRGRVRDLISTAAQEYGFKGIKVHAHDARISREICESAREFGLPVIYDVAGEVSVTELLAREYPDVAFIIPHLGSFADDWKAQMALIDPLTRHANIFADTSGVRRFDVLLEAVQRAGPEKILFGSDGPYLHPGVELAKVKALGLSPHAENLIVGANLIALLSNPFSAPLHARARNASLPVVLSVSPPWRRAARRS